MEVHTADVCYDLRDVARWCDESRRARAKIESVERAHDDAVRERNAAVDNVERLRELLKDARADVDYFQEWAEFNGRRLNTWIAWQRRYRLAWLSARRRAAEESNLGAEAVQYLAADRDRWQRRAETAEARLLGDD
ncbi:hypothetical protein [Streptomyces californicus]|uniref:hypothetical protein n=1 Tax=Streptomyces californicus TaxID=67351 RepID=UPI0012FF5680|nr:hypothetical protein [Streptomyces californicus]QRV53476.1 hypothetical protein I6J40_04145 [Streptomyces californicus]